MHYLEDLIEYLDDLPEELQHRMEQIRQWDETVNKMKTECAEMEMQIFDPETTLTHDQKQSIALNIAEKIGKMRSLSNKKDLLAERCCFFMEKLYKKASESLESFQMELTVDNPGVVEQIQEKFKRGIERRQHEEQYSTERRGIFESDESGRSTPDVFVPDLKAEKRNILKERNAKNGKGRYGKGKPLGKGATEEVKRRPGRRPGKDGVLSHYMRKKQERLREQQKMMEIHARREEERKRRENNAMIRPIDITAFCAQACSSTTPTKEGFDIKEAHNYEEDDEGLNLFADLADMLGPDDQIRDDVDLGANTFNILSTLGREDLELIESMNDGAMFTTDEETISGLGAASSSQSPMYSLSSSFEGNSMVNRSLSPSKPMASASSSLTDLSDDRKKKKITFSCTSDTSLHGRPRKLTDRAAQMVEQTIKKINKKNKETADEPVEERWCFCRQGSYGTMVACELIDHGCPYQWFHLDCAGLSEVPPGKWYCSTCRKKVFAEEEIEENAHDDLEEDDYEEEGEEEMDEY